MNKTRNFNFTICFLFALFLCTIKGNGQSVEYYHLNNNNGLSNSAVNTIFQDSENIMWFGTWDGLNRYDGTLFEQYRPQSREKASLSHQIIRSISEENNKFLWITTDYGINRMNKQTEEFDHYFLDYHKSYIYQEKSFSCSINHNGIIAAAFKGSGLYLFDQESESFTPVQIDGYNSNPAITALFFDERNYLWLQEQSDKLLRIEITQDHQAKLIQEIILPEKVENIFYDQNKYIWFTQDTQLHYINVYDIKPKINPTDIKIEGTLNTVYSHNNQIFIGTTNGCFVFSNNRLVRYLDTEVSVLSLYKGTQDILWIGTDGKGIYQKYKKPNFITLIDQKRFAHTNNFPIRAILQDKNNNIWIGSKGGGLSRISYLGVPNFETFSNYNVGIGRTYNSVLSLAQGNNCIWVGTDGFKLQYFDTQNNKLKYPDFLDSSLAQAICSVYSILQTDSSTLYVGTSGEGFFKLSINTKNQIENITQFKHIDDNPNSVSSNIIYAILDDGDFLWIATRGGGLNQFNKKTHQFSIYKNEPDNSNSICSNDVISLLKDSSGKLWIGTTSGMSILTTDKDGTNKFKYIEESSGLPNTNIHAILEDCYHYIWVSTSNGLAKINPNTYQITAYYHEEGLQDNEFSDGAGFANAKGTELYFGGINGFNILHPSLIASKDFTPNLILNHVKVDNMPYQIHQNTIKTNYQTGSISLSFSVLDYLDNKKCQIAYKLEKRTLISNKKDAQWSYIGNNRNIILNELSSGEYTLYVKSCNSEQVWNTPMQFSILITPPLWATQWAIWLYILIVTLGIWLFYRVKKTRLIMNHELEMEKQEKIKKEEIHQAKLRFFTNIAHEFSNSITLIYGAIEQIFMNENPDVKIKKQLLAIRRNTERMHEQIQELMEFRKAETGHLHVQLEQVDICELIKCTLDNFIDIADSKKINLTFDIQENLPLWIIDRSMLEKVIFNLLSNAIKYTPTEGYIKINATIDTNNQLIIACTNNGPGIRPEDLSNVFNRFTILDNFETKLSQGLYTRNGIGLALCKDLVNLMGGVISVNSEINQYTTFTITLPHHTDNEISVVKEMMTAPQDKTAGLFTNQRPIVLIIDDQEDIRTLIKDVLGEEYEVIPASNGLVALNILKDTLPDLIICDIIMPQMNGIEFISQIKKEKRTQYIPIIMLSSKSTIESHINVLETGANMFINKPFHPRYLKAAVERILKNDSMMKTFSESPAAYREKYNNTLISKEDKQFIDRVIEAISNNFGDENYNQDSLSSDLVISRVQLYRKIKQITQSTPGDFIRNYRLKQAENMLIHTDKTVSEIILECGFHNKAYFYREFAKLHNCSPKDFRAQKGQDEDAKSTDL